MGCEPNNEPMPRHPDAKPALSSTALIRIARAEATIIKHDGFVELEEIVSEAVEGLADDEADRVGRTIASRLAKWHIDRLSD